MVSNFAVPGRLHDFVGGASLPFEINVTTLLSAEGDGFTQSGAQSLPEVTPMLIFSRGMTKVWGDDHAADHDIWDLCWR